MNNVVTDYPQEEFVCEAIKQPKLGMLIKENRKAKKLSQRQLGEQIGVSYQTIAYWENGLRAPVPANLMRLAKALDKPNDFFFSRVPGPKNDSTMSSFCENLRNYRKAYGISQVKLSEQTGIALNKIKAYEDENSGLFITNDNLKKLCEFFKTESQELLGCTVTAEALEGGMIKNYLQEIHEAVETLNVVGLSKAAERIKEIAEISRYRK